MSARAWAAFAAVSLLWGIPYLLIKVAVEEGVPPAFLAWVRVVLGAAVLMALAWRAGVLRALRGRWRWLAAFAAAEIAVPFPLIAMGEQHVDSSLAAILIAAAPLFVALLALRFDATERATGRRLAGLVIGLAGVVALVGIDVAGRTDELLGAAAILTAAFCYAVGPMVLKRHLADLDPRVSMGASLVLAAVLLAPAAAIDPPIALPSATAIGALLALGLLCTAAALVIFGALIAEVGAGRALVVTYVNPVVAVALGMALLGERPGAGAVVGLMLILLGSWLSTGGVLPRRTEKRPPMNATRLHLAQFNVGRMRAPIDDPIMEGFRSQLERINAIADQSPGFVWRLQTPEGDATAIRAYADPLMAVNMSVWESLEALHEYVYRSPHVGPLRDRREWFEPAPGPILVLWWVAAGHIPTVEEAKARLEHLRVHGPTETAFTFRRPFPPPGELEVTAPAVDAEFCSPSG